MKKEKLVVSKVLKAMDKYLHNKDRNFHINLYMAYCNTCKTVTSVGGDYMSYTGSGCGDDNHERVRSAEKCGSCSNISFIDISVDDMSRFKEIYKERAAEILINGMDNGLKEMDYPTLYNKELPKIVNKWNKLDKTEKINQINQLFNLQKELSDARKKVRSLEKEVLAE